MKSTHRQVVGALFGLFLITACRGGGGGTNNPNPDGMPPSDMSSVVHIQDVQSDTMAAGTPVELHGVVVTAVDKFGVRNSDFWIEEPGGGPRSGLHVFGATPTAVADLAPGDIVDITGGIKSEFAISDDRSGRTVTELQAPRGAMLTITKTGVGTIPPPVAVDALAIGQLATQAMRDAEWEKWEGVLVTVNGALALNPPRCITTRGSCTDPTFESFDIPGVAKAESSLVAFPTPKIKTGDCFASITGVVDYVFDYLIYPRSAADMVAGGANCPPRELQTLCIDGVDNDGSGFKDCMDFSCAVGPDAWLGASCTPADATCGCSANLAAGMSADKVNTGTTGPVLMHGMYVTAVGATGFWVADSTTAAPNGGVLVFTNAAPTVAIGQQLTSVQGNAGPFNGSDAAGSKSVIEITSPTVGTVMSSGATFTPISDATASTLADLTAGAPFAGSLVQLQFLKVKAVVAHRVTLVDNNNVTITMADGALPNFAGSAPAVNDCYTNVTGVMDFNTFNDPQIRTINPTVAADLVKGTGCTGN